MKTLSEVMDEHKNLCEDGLDGPTSPELLQDMQLWHSAKFDSRVRLRRSELYIGDAAQFLLKTFKINKTASGISRTEFFEKLNSGNKPCSRGVETAILLVAKIPFTTEQVGINKKSWNDFWSTGTTS